MIERVRPRGGFTINFRGLELSFQGGPYVAKPDGTFGVCMLPTVPGEMEVGAHVPTRDFTPPPEKELCEAVDAAIRAAIKGQTVYVGCTAGIGRTGTFMAAVVKALEVNPSPIAWVRMQYYSNAVETSEQANLIERLDFSGLPDKMKWPVRKRKLALIFQGWRNNVTDRAQVDNRLPK
jgi:hypothetical protein